MAQQEEPRTVKTIRLEVLHKNPYGSLLANKEYRICTIELKENSKECASNFMDTLNQECIKLLPIISQPLNLLDPEKRKMIDGILDAKVFWDDPETFYITNQGPWDAMETMGRINKQHREKIQKISELVEMLPAELKEKLKEEIEQRMNHRFTEV